MADLPNLTIGIEEEYLIVDQKTCDLVQQPPEDFFQACIEEMGEQVTGEFLQCQVEVGTKPHAKVPDAAVELLQLRQGIARVATEFGFAPIAASTHPFAKWRSQKPTRKERYDLLESDMGQVVNRMLICGMHIHVGLNDPDTRIDLMQQVSYFLPHILALSVSSPFWEGDDTGLNSYRLAVFDAMPRTGLPDSLDSYTEYRRLIDALITAGCLEDATKVWWDIRPSDKFPTLEQRITDICSRVADAAAIAAMYQSLLGYLLDLKTKNQRWRVYPNLLIQENRWQAQRHGINGKLVDLGKSAMVPYSQLIQEILEIVGDQAHTLGCHRELMQINDIMRDGTSADRQRGAFKAALTQGADQTEANRAVVRHLMQEYLSN